MELSSKQLLNSLFSLILIASFVVANPKYQINLFAGVCSDTSCTGGYNTANGPATSTQINGPCGMAITSDGTLYWADYKNHVVRKVVNGYISTIAGVIGTAGDGTSSVPTSCQLNVPQDVFVDSSSGAVYIVDNGNHKIRVVYPDHTIATIAGTGVSGFSGDGGLAVNAQLSSPRGIYVFNSKIYIADHGNQRIRMIDNGTIQTIAGNGQVGSAGDGGPATLASLCYPTSVRVAPSGNVYISYFDHQVNAIRKVDTNGIISTVIQSPSKMVGQNFWVMDDERKIIIPNWYQNTISIFTYPEAVQTIIAGITNSSGYSGDGGDSLEAKLFWPYGAVVDNNGRIYISDNFNNAIRTLTPNCNSGQVYNTTELNCLDVCFGVASNLPNVCSGHGTCDAPDVCRCQPGWGGFNCSMPTCFGMLQNSSSVCSGHGTCDAPDICRCQYGWGGSNCELPKCFGILQNSSNVCNGHGSCYSVDTCACDSHWGGGMCSLPKCFGFLQGNSSVCNGHGTCDGPNICRCSAGWYGSNCSIPSCFSKLANETTTVCSGHGSCSSPDNCSCQVGYMGSQCEIEINHPQPVPNESCWNSNSEIGAPKPLISSQIIEDGIQFSLNFSVDPNVKFTHEMLIGENSSFHAETCRLTGGQKVNLTLTNSTTSSCFNVYTSTRFTLDELMSNSNVKKELLGEWVKLTIPIALFYFDEMGIDNGGFCRAYQFTTNQIMYVKLSSTVFSFFDEFTPLLPYSVNLYPQEFSTHPTSGVLQIQMILRAGNVTLQSFTFYNTTNSNYYFQVSESSFMYQNGPYAFYQIRIQSNVKVNDFRALSYFRAIFKRDGFMDDLVQDIPLKIDYSIVDGPSDKNFTLQASMYLASNDWTPKSKFKSGEKVYAQVQTSSSLGNNHLIVNDAYLCCFKSFTPSISYNPSQGEYGCSQFHSETMDVWKTIISNQVANSELETTLYPYYGSKTLYGFSFTLIPSMFPQKYSNASTSCFVQSNVGLTPLSRSSSAVIMALNGESTSGSNSASSLFVVQVLPGTTGAASHSRVSGVSSNQRVGLFMMVFMISCVCVFQALVQLMMGV
ncbi:hypothetical protein C9374_007534 [Naegleria lovaniensis]|uniref:EGF-like domain-containing protein n=1 Tax=Naegleria lovaniensis TaxID=51637 RepID=A0AA88GM79_NAELO|nr:uncharacterized protein C9374_007534 [Naegleria lovaniensis]KAG2379395.1 hypothetical protein C9374_007534 [Naegleria lovaniensis]